MGSEEVRLFENRVADEAGWRRMESAKVLEEHIAKKLLVPVPQKTAAYYLDKVPKELRYLRQPAGEFLERISGEYRTKFRKQLKITSLTETAKSKEAQGRGNPNAAPAYGDMRSVHLTGAAFDISLKPLKWNERVWMRARLVFYEKAGLIDATEEIYGNCFHVFALPQKRPS